MIKLVGMAMVLMCVGGGFVLSHGVLAALWQPYELLIIGGAAFGAFMIANTPKVIKETGKAIPAAIFGGHFSREQYLDLLALLYQLFNKWRREGLVAAEADIENPESSEIFQAYPRVSGDKEIVVFITDYMRIIASGNMSAFEVESLIDMELETAMYELDEPGHALTRLADGMPGFGIVAAVLGIVVTMKSLGGPPAEIGGHVAAALVGTFLGILLAYGFVGPLSVAVEHMAKEHIKIKQCIKAALLATANGVPPQLAAEFGRKTLASDVRPTFSELEEHIRGR
jgi:chemotaxis protein MotA